MSKITVTNENIDKFVKRFHKIAGKDLGKSLSESQELFAKSLGTKNYHELKVLLNSQNFENDKKTITPLQSEKYDHELIKEILEKEKKEEFNANNEHDVAKRFLNRLINILHAPNSKIALAFYYSESKTIFFYSIYGDCYTYTFGEDHKLPKYNDYYDSYSDTIQVMSQDKGLSNIDGRYLNFVFQVFTVPNITQMFYSKEIGENLSRLLGNKKNESILKSGKINNIRVIDDKIYFAHQAIFFKKTYENFIRNSKVTIDYNNEKYIVTKRKDVSEFKFDYSSGEEYISVEYYTQRSGDYTLFKAI
jgi:hypothetical protein